MVRGLLLCSVSLASASAVCSYTADSKRNVDFKNWRAVSATSKEDCCQKCADDKVCEFSTFHSKINSCRLKSGVSTGTVHEKGTFTCDQTAVTIVELAESVPALSTLVAAVVAGDLADTLSSPGPFTVFAPTNDAFGALPAGMVDSLMKPENKGQLVDILTYHVLPVQVLSTDLKSSQRVKTVEGKNLHVYKDSTRGVRVTPDGKDFKTVTAADNKASNGVAHIIDGVLLPPAAPTQTIVELAESVKTLSTLVAAVVAGDLADTLSSAGPFTVFAPTNDAFQALPAGTLDSLMKPENKAQLVDILTYHVLPEQVLASDLAAFQAVNTIEGNKLHVQKWGGLVKVGPSLRSKDLKTVITADNLATNGVAHIIDGVLLPKSSDMVV